MRTVYKLFTTSRLLYLPFHRIIERIKSQTSSHFLWDFARVIERTNFQSLYLYKSSFLCQVTTLTQNFFFFPVYIKATTNAFWWGCFAKVPSLNSHENRVLRGYFFKNSNYVYKALYFYKRSFLKKSPWSISNIQTIFTIVPLI